MKKLFLFLLVTLSIQSFGQLGYSSFLMRTAQSTREHPVQLDTVLQFVNSQPVHKIWRSDSTYVSTIVPPTNYVITEWQILDHESDNLIDMGSGNTISHASTFVSMDSSNIYDITIMAIRSTGTPDTIKQRLAGEFSCYNKPPTVFDETWSSSGGHDMGWTNRPGYAIRITGDISGQVNFWWLKSDDPTNPIHIVVDDVDIASATWNFTGTALNNVIIDGCADENVQYGLRGTKTEAGQNQMFQITLAEPNDATRRSGNIVFMGIYMDGSGIAGAGNTGVRIIPPNDATTNNTNYSTPKITGFNVKIRNTHEEGTYWGATNTTLTSGRTYSYILKSFVYDWDIANVGNEAWQGGSIMNLDFFHNRLSTSGTRNQNLHENLLQLGHCGGAVYQNWFEQYTHNTIAWFPSRIGTKIEFFSNVIYTTGKDGDGAGNMWGRSDEADDYATIEYSFFNNTVVWTAGVSAFTLYENARVWDKFNVVGNIIVGASTTNFENGNGMDAGHTVFDNVQKLTANIGDLLFVDSANKDYHLSSISSPAFAEPSTSITKVSKFANYDYEGIEFKAPMYGAFSGYELNIFE